MRVNYIVLCEDRGNDMGLLLVLIESKNMDNRHGFYFNIFYYSLSIEQLFFASYESCFGELSL